MFNLKDYLKCEEQRREQVLGKLHELRIHLGFEDGD